MKRIFLFSIIFFFLLAAVNAQRYQQKYGRQAYQDKLNSVSVEYGFLSTVNLTVYLGSSIIDYFIDEYGNEINHTGYAVTGPLGISYMRRINNFEIGSSLWFSRHSIHFSGYDYGAPTVKTFGLLFDANYIYYSRNSFELYSGISLGPGYFKISNVVDEAIIQKLEKYLSSVYLASHLNLFGIRYGKDIGVCIETGFGHKGLIHFGVDYRF